MIGRADIGGSSATDSDKIGRADIEGSRPVGFNEALAARRTPHVIARFRRRAPRLLATRALQSAAGDGSPSGAVLVVRLGRVHRQTARVAEDAVAAVSDARLANVPAGSLAPALGADRLAVAAGDVPRLVLRGRR